jgi:hypothetical protein
VKWGGANQRVGLERFVNRRGPSECRRIVSACVLAAISCGLALLDGSIAASVALAQTPPPAASAPAGVSIGGPPPSGAAALATAPAPASAPAFPAPGAAAPDASSAAPATAPTPASQPAFPAPGAATLGAPAAPAPPPSAADALQTRSAALDATINGLLDIPQAPAAFTLGIASDKVARPGDLRDAAAHVTMLLGPGGKIVPGAAMEVAPLRSLSAHLTIDEWHARADLAHRLLDSIRLSIATAADPAAAGVPDAPPLIAAGARLSLIDERDYRNQPGFIADMRKALAACFPDRVTPEGEGGKHFSSIAAIKPDCQSLDTLTDRLREQYLTRGHRLELASALVASDRALTASARWQSTRVWAAYEYGLGAPAVGLAAQYDRRRDLSGKTVNDVHLGGQAHITTTEIVCSLALGYARVDDDHDALDFGGSLSLKVQRWGILRAALQGTRDFGAKTTDVIALIAFATANDETFFSRAINYISGSH